MIPGVPDWLSRMIAIAILLLTVSVVLRRLPKIDLGHSAAFLRRRRANWLPLGMTYAFLYMGRYNLTVSKNFLPGMTNEDFGTIFFWGTLTYGCAFLINGPLCDKFGGRKTILAAASGSALMNLAMGYVLHSQYEGDLVLVFSVLYSLNMYFQSFGAVSIVKVNAHWFHVRERGTFGGIFGILISLGVYFAYDWNRPIAAEFGPKWAFFAPSVLLSIFFVIAYLTVRDTPSDAGFEDFDTADASSGESDERLPVFVLAKRMLTNPILLTIALVEFCSGYLRQAIMQWYTIFAKQTGQWDGFVATNWGLLLCCAGILGGVFAGTLSDHVFGSRRGPVAALLYALMLVGAAASWFLLESPALGFLMVFMSLCIIGVHGMLSGTASMDFGGKKNAGLAVGIIDGFVYLGTAVQAILLGRLLPKDGSPGVENPQNWSAWPIAMVPMAAIGLILALRLWHARPGVKGAKARDA